MSSLGLSGRLAMFAAPPAGAHPLGNFTINHYDGLTVHADRVDLRAVVDSAEIPTRQELPSVDVDGDDVVSTREAEAHAVDQCDQFSRAVVSDVDGRPLRFAVRTAVVRYPPGEGGLPTTRLVCELTASADLGAAARAHWADLRRETRAHRSRSCCRGAGAGLVCGLVTILNDPHHPHRTIWWSA